MNVTLSDISVISAIMSVVSVQQKLRYGNMTVLNEDSSVKAMVVLIFNVVSLQ